MRIEINLKGFEKDIDVLKLIGDVLDFGGTEKSWGQNWDALNDSMRYLENGGIWGTSKKFIFPLEIVFVNFDSFEENDLENYQLLQKVMNYAVDYYSKNGKQLKVTFEK